MEELTYFELCGRPACVFENHASAFVPWAQWSRKFSKPLSLITLDHHTDTNPSYLRHYFSQVGRDLEKMEEMRCEQVKQIDLECDDSVIKALDGLYHDEHIDLAIRCGIFDKAYVLQHSHHEMLPEWEDHDMVVCPMPFDREQVSEQEYRAYIDVALEDDHLRRLWTVLPDHFDLEEEHYILDIDIDLFKSRRSLQPENKGVFLSMVQHAAGITIAKESEWVQRLCFDEGFGSAEMLEELLKLCESPI